MDKFDLYEDLELEHEKEKKESLDDLRWKEKYTVALNTIEKLQAEKKELNRKIKQLEINFASLLETARTEIKRKDTQICELRKQKDDICFRRFKPKVAELQSHEHSNDNRSTSSGEKVKVNPFSCERKPVDQKNNESIVSNEKPTAKERLENGKHHYEKSKYRDQDSRRAADEKVGNSRKRSRDRSNDRNRDRDRSRNRNEYRSRHRSNDRRDHKHRDRFDSRKRERSKERHSRKDDRKEDQHSRRHERNNSGSRSSEGSLQKSNKNTQPNSQETSRKHANEVKPKEPHSSAKEHDIHRTKDPKTEDCATKSDPLVTKKPDQKIEILQIEILKDVKELKKSKLEAEKLPKPPPCDPMKVQTQKSNQFLDALFDDPLMNQAAESNTDLYDDLEKDQNIDSGPAERRENNSLKMDENCNLNFETPKRQPVSMDDLFGPSPVGSLCSVIGKSHNAAGSPNDVDFVAIEEPQKEKRALDSATIDLSNDCQDENPPSSFKNGTKLCTNENQSRTDTNFRCQLQTPQKQVMAKVYDDLFGPSPANSNCGQTISIDKPSNDSYFEPIPSSINGGKEERTQETAPILIDNSSSEESTESQRQDKGEYKNRPAEDAKSFKFVELDSSFYSSEDEANDAAGKNQIRTSPRVDEVEELSASQSKNTRNVATREIACAKSETETFSSDITSKSAEMLSKTQTEKENHHKSSPEEEQNQLQISSNSSSSHHRSDRHSKNESRKHSSKNHRTSHHKASPKSESDEKHSSRHRHTKEKHHNKRDSLSSHTASQSPRRHSKSHHRHKAKRSRNDSFKERTSSLQSEDDRLKEKPTEQDQVFFLHCEELSDDDEILDSSVSIEIQEHDLVQNDKPNVEEDTNQEANVTDHQPTHLIPNQTLQNEFVERVEDERIRSDEKDLEPQTSAENEVEPECIGASDPEKCKNVETLESVQDHREQEVTESNTTITNATSGKPSEEAEPELGSREISETNNLENQLAGPKNEVENPVEQNIFPGKQNEVEDLVNSKEHEIFETQQSGPGENGPLASENLNSNEHSQQQERVDSDISTRKEEEPISKCPSNLHKELNEEPIPIMPEEELSDHIEGHLLLTDDEEKSACISKSGEDNRQESVYVQLVPETNKPFPEEKLATEISSRSSFEPNLTVIETTNEHVKGPVEQKQETKPPSDKVEEPNASSLSETIVKTQSDNEPAKIESTIQSPLLPNALISSPLKLSRNSVDDNENSAHSSTESTTSGRRRKIKTPRKRTDDFIKTTNPSIDVKFDSNSKFDESPSGMQSEMNSKQSKSLSVVLENDKEVEERLKSGAQSITDSNRYNSETVTHTNTSIRDLDSIGEDAVTRKEESNFGDADESGIPHCQGNAEDNNNSSQLQDNSMQKKEEGELSTIDKPTQISPISEEKPAFLNKVKLSENKPNEDAKENENTNVTENLVDQGENPVIVSHTESDKAEIDKTKQIDSPTPQEEASSCANDSSNKIVEFKPDDIQKIVETFSISITRKRIKKKPTKNAIEPVSVISNEVGVDNPTEECLKETNDQEVKIKPPPHIYDDKPCCSSSLNVRLLNGTKYSAKKTKQKSRQPQMMKHFMDSEHILVGECNYQSVSFSAQSVDTNSNEIKPNNRKRKSKADSSLNNTTQSSSPDKPKRKYKRKIPQFLESSLSNDDVGHKRIDENVENLSLKEPPKEKRKYTKRKPKQSEWLEEPTSSLSKLDLNDQRDSDKFSESVRSQPEPERLTDIISETREHTESLSQKEIGQSSPKVKSNNHPKRQRKRKLSEGESKNVSIVSESKKSKTRDEEISDTQSFGSSNAGTVHPHKSPNPRNKSIGLEKSTESVELTPTHHKIFLNDVFPNDPPPVYKANDDDHQYHEIDDRLRCMFQSPSYTQSSNGEYSLDKTNDDHVDVTCDSQNLTINETLLSQSEPTKLSDLSSSSTKKLSLGSNEYVIESIGSHAANVFITRKKCKKRTRVVAGAM